MKLNIKKYRFVIILLLLVLWSAKIYGQNLGALYVEPDRFRLDPGRYSILTLPLPRVISHLSVYGGVGLIYSSNNFSLISPTDDTQYQVIEGLLSMPVFFTVGLFELVEFGVEFPLSFYSGLSSNENMTTEPGSWHGDPLVRDMVLSLKTTGWEIFDNFFLGGKLSFSVPISALAERPLAGESSWTVYPELLTYYKWSRVQLAFSLGYKIKPNYIIYENTDRNELTGFTLDRSSNNSDIPDEIVNPWLSLNDEIIFKVGVNVEVLTNRLFAFAEIETGMNLMADEDLEKVSFFEGWLGASYRFNNYIQLTAGGGGGGGLLNAPGTADWRIFSLLSFFYERTPCEFGPEDFDGYHDEDFCADPDNDSDGIEDSDDQCMLDPEDRDNFFDEDGCPDPDNDADGILDANDMCIDVPEDRDGFQDEDGCPDTDNDSDGIADESDQCPMEPEDLDQYQDEDGCPEPGPDEITVTITDTHILINERIYFSFDSDIISPESTAVLDRVAEALKQQPRIKKVRVEGHTDNVGGSEYNMDLSYRRARSVMEYIIRQGVSADRLTYEGYGDTRPVAPNDATEGQAMNRRVDFTILEWEGGSRKE